MVKKLISFILATLLAVLNAYGVWNKAVLVCVDSALPENKDYTYLLKHYGVKKTIKTITDTSKIGDLYGLLTHSKKIELKKPDNGCFCIYMKGDSNSLNIIGGTKDMLIGGYLYETNRELLSKIYELSEFGFSNYSDLEEVNIEDIDFVDIKKVAPNIFTTRDVLFYEFDDFFKGEIITNMVSNKQCILWLMNILTIKRESENNNDMPIIDTRFVIDIHLKNNEDVIKIYGNETLFVVNNNVYKTDSIVSDLIWSTNFTRDYCGDIIYKDDEIERILTDNGYAVLDARTGGYKYYYYVKDYQGNIRAVLDEAGNVVESNGYYPYGMPYADNYTSVQPYKYGGKELDRTNGLDMYDFHARQYDPAFPCFTSIDELCEKYPSISPYAYCMGNPINAIDPDGRRTWRIRKDGSIYDYSDKNKSFDAFVIVDSKGNTKTDSDGNEICIKFDYGTVTMVENVPVSFGDATYNLTMFHIKGDDNAQQLFEFMANPQETTNVEWSHTKIGTEDSQKNVVGTSGERQHTHQKGYLYEKGYTIRYDAHNHPLGNKASKNDVRSRDTIKRKFPSSEILLYTLKNGIGNYDTIPPIYTK